MAGDRTRAGRRGLSLYNYVAILAAIPAVCGFIGAMLFVRTGFFSSLIFAAINYLLTFAIVYVVALIVDALGADLRRPEEFWQCAQAHGLFLHAGLGRRHLPSGPAACVPGPSSASTDFICCWLGLPVLMRCPDDKAIIYAIAVVISAIVLTLLLGAIVGAMLGFSLARLSDAMAPSAPVGTPPAGRRA